MIRGYFNESKETNKRIFGVCDASELVLTLLLWLRKLCRQQM